MMSRVAAPVCLLTGVLLCIILQNPVHHVKLKYHDETMTNIGNMPSSFIRAAALEFHGLAADMMFLKTMTYAGLKLQEQKKTSNEEWQQTYAMLNAVTDLDPRFWDPYLFAEVMFAWQNNMQNQANKLLLKAAHYRPNDYQPYYFLGFNAFYFNHDAAKAAPYLRKSASRPGAPGFLKGLAARFSLYGSQTKLGILFLANLLKSTSNPKTRTYLTKRLQTLKKINYLEDKVKEFQNLEGYLPNSLKELVSSGLITAIPKDPYGGKFTIMPNGRVYTTSNMIKKKSKKSK